MSTYWLSGAQQRSGVTLARFPRNARPYRSASLALTRSACIALSHLHSHALLSLLGAWHSLHRFPMPCFAVRTWTRATKQASAYQPHDHTLSLSLLTHKIVRNTFSLMNWLSGLFYYLYNQEWKKMFSTDLGQYHFIMPFYYIALTSFIKKEKECQLIFIPVLSNTQL